MKKMVFVVISMFISSFAFGGCAEYSSTCIVIPEKSDVENIECEISECANMSSYSSSWDIPGWVSVNIGMGTEESHVTIDGEEAHYAADEDIPESVRGENLSCVTVKYSGVIYCHKS